ncbi:hypothetical protein [Methylocystis bryophila]|uniref:Uncharacterized protein n=1 Tax=Methylocystis bryophila TaxID=655015 RepID=A0A1W6MTU6_9HYPH|nr:hypothetical protein [Methylocystis bryophila]ARN80946.1 hypothetical protein B1812_07525 [Methylocystis bryophila]BDV36850.1 hypothetical protein DSM21852_01030 [Methylocystis bryophila]
MDFLEALKKVIDWAAAMPFLPKLIITAIVLVVFTGGSLLFVLSVWTPPPGIVYDAAVLEAVNPADDPIGAAMGGIEPFPAFPYYSQTSDHPSQWPPRVFKDRTEFMELIHALEAEPIQSELKRWPQRTEKLRVAGRGVDPGAVEYARLRMLLTENSENFAAVRATTGPRTADALERLELRRKEIEQTLPNRVLALRIKNDKPVDAENFVVEINVAGAVYDVTVNLEGEAAKSQKWTPNRFAIEIPRLRPGFTADVQVWYQYLPLSERVFPGPKDVEWDATEGVVVANLGISNDRLRHDPRLLDDLQAYHRYNVDPLRGSPTFGRLPEKVAEVRPARERRAAKETPPAQGVQALLIATNAIERLATQAEAKHASDSLDQAMTRFRSALAEKVAAVGGVWLLDQKQQVHASYNPFARAYLLTGGTIALLRLPSPIDMAGLPGWTEIKGAGAAVFEYRPWVDARFEAVLHFFSDPADTRKDSKRLLTKALTLDEIFDVSKAEAGKRNSAATLFVQLLQYSGARIRAHYRLPFSLKTNDEPAPFYLVVRGKEVSENFYLPREWMPLADQAPPPGPKSSTLHDLLSRLYDYGDHSRELTAEEFDAVFKK